MTSAAAPSRPAAPRRPGPVAAAAALLTMMGAVGVAYAAVTVAVTPGTVRRSRAGATGVDPAEADGVVALVWTRAAAAVLVSAALFAQLLVLAAGLRRGRPGARTGTWVLAGLGALCGCG